MYIFFNRQYLKEPDRRGYYILFLHVVIYQQGGNDDCCLHPPASLHLIMHKFAAVRHTGFCRHISHRV